MKFRIPMRAFVLVGMLFLCLGCSESEPTQEPIDLFEHGEFLIREQRWGEARDVLRQFLLENPEHAGAHFYLGRSYLWWEQDFRPAIAEGELQTALKFFCESGEHHIERFEDEYFEIICNIESAKIYARLLISLEAIGAPRSVLLPLVERGWVYVEAARAVNPEHPDVLWGDEVFLPFFDALDAQRPIPN